MIKRPPIRMSTSDCAVYDFIEEYYCLKGYSPSIREVMERTGLKSTDTVNHHIKRLEWVGWITRMAHKVRTIVPTREPRVYYRLRE